MTIGTREPPHLVHVFPSFGTGGAEVRTAIIINATAGLFRHTILSITGETRGKQLVNGNAILDRVPRPDSLGGFPRAIGKALRALRPDLLLTYGWGGMDAIIAGRLCGVRRIVHVEDGFLPDETARQKPHRLLVRQVVLRAASRLVIPSQTLAGIADRLWHLPARKVCYVPNGVDSSRFAPGPPHARSAARRRLGFAETDVVVGTVGHLRPEKNHARLLDALANTRSGSNLKLLLVGDGELRGALERQIQERGLSGRVVFAGAVADPSDCYRAMDLFALSSDTEQMPIVVLEAMATGLAVVSTDVGDVRGMVVAGNQEYVTPLGDEAAFTRALDTLSRDHERRATLGGANKLRACAVYDLRVMVDRHRLLYDELIAFRAATAPRTDRVH